MSNKMTVLRIQVVLAMALVTTLSVTSLSAERDVDTIQNTARKILNDTGVQGGLVVHIGCGDGKLAAALGTGDKYSVQGLGADDENIRKMILMLHYRRHAP